MSRLIDADMLKDTITTDYYEHFTRHHDTDQIALVDMVCDDIDEAPTVQPEVRRGKWIEPDYVYFGAKQYICDQCKDDEFWEKRCVNYKDNFCPNCGAKMDLEG